MANFTISNINGTYAANIKEYGIQQFIDACNKDIKYQNRLQGKNIDVKFEEKDVIVAGCRYDIRGYYILCTRKKRGVFDVYTLDLNRKMKDMSKY